MSPGRVSWTPRASRDAPQQYARKSRGLSLPITLSWAIGKRVKFKETGLNIEWNATSSVPHFKLNPVVDQPSAQLDTQIGLIPVMSFGIAQEMLQHPQQTEPLTPQIRQIWQNIHFKFKCTFSLMVSRCRESLP
jgi:hypothetical protein